MAHGENENRMRSTQSRNSFETTLDIFSSISVSPRVPNAMKWIHSRVRNGPRPVMIVLASHRMNGLSRSIWREDANTIRISLSAADSGIWPSRVGTHVNKDRTHLEDPMERDWRSQAEERSILSDGYCDTL